MGAGRHPVKESWEGTRVPRVIKLDEMPPKSA